MLNSEIQIEYMSLVLRNILVGVGIGFFIQYQSMRTRQVTRMFDNLFAVRKKLFAGFANGNFIHAFDSILKSMMGVYARLKKWIRKSIMAGWIDARFANATFEGA